MDGTSDGSFSSYLDTSFSDFGSSSVGSPSGYGPGYADPNYGYTPLQDPNPSYTGEGSYSDSGATKGALTADALKAAAGAYQYGISGQQAKQAASASDPFAPQREQYAQMLQRLMASPSTELPKTPGYQAGMDAVQRSLLAQGYQGSGKMMAGMLEYGGNIFNEQVKTLGHLAGADVGSPAAAGQALSKGSAAQSNDLGNMISTVGQVASIAMMFA